MPLLRGPRLACGSCMSNPGLNAPRRYDGRKVHPPRSTPGRKVQNLREALVDDLQFYSVGAAVIPASASAINAAKAYK